MVLVATEGERAQSIWKAGGRQGSVQVPPRRDDETSPATNIIEDRETSSP